MQAFAMIRLLKLLNATMHYAGRTCSKAAFEFPLCQAFFYMTLTRWWKSVFWVLWTAIWFGCDVQRLDAQFAFPSAARSAEESELAGGNCSSLSCTEIRSSHLIEETGKIHRLSRYKGGSDSLLFTPLTISAAQSGELLFWGKSNEPALKQLARSPAATSLSPFCLSLSESSLPQWTVARKLTFTPLQTVAISATPPGRRNNQRDCYCAYN